MAEMKIHPPERLNISGISEAHFEIWKNQLEVFLGTNKKFRKFKPGNNYATWIAAEVNEARIITPVAPDTIEQLEDIREDLHTLLQACSTIYIA